jgi:NADPH2:quinone reductase
MKAIRVHETGGPDVLRLEQIAEPHPGPGEAVVRHHAVGLNFIDTYFRSGLYPTPLPFTPGNEGAGVVVSVGEGVSTVKPGDRVAYAGQIGAYCEARAVRAEALVKLPRAMSFELAASIMLKGLTAEYLLHRSHPVRPGEIVLIQAAAGGTGQILTQWAAHLGAEVIATVGSEDKAAIARDCGARHVINYRTHDFAAEVKRITAGRLCDVAYDGVGKATFPAVLDCLRPTGKLISFGNASGPIEALNLGLLSQKGSLYVQRPTLFTYTAMPGQLAVMARRLFRVIAAGAVRIAPPNVFRLEDAAAAHRALEGRETTGSTVLIP